mgnify:CR=1 FL=1
MDYALITANRNYSSWSLRPWLLMKGLGLEFEDRFEPFTKPSNYEEFRAFSPTGQVPVLLHEGHYAVTALPLLRRTLPGARLAIVEGLTSHIVEWITTGRVDIGDPYRGASARQQHRYLLADSSTGAGDEGHAGPGSRLLHADLLLFQWIAGSGFIERLRRAWRCP